MLELGVDMVFVDALKSEVKKRVGRGRSRLVERALDLEDKLPRAHHSEGLALQRQLR